MAQKREFTEKDPRIKKRIRSRSGAELQEKITLIRGISSYVYKIADLYDSDRLAVVLVRQMTGYPDRSYSLPTLQSVYDQVQTLYHHQKAAADKRKVHGVVSDVSLLEEALAAPLRRSQSKAFCSRSRAQSIDDYDLGPEHFGR